MSRILEIALRNHQENIIEEDFSPEQLFKRSQPESITVGNIEDVPIEADKETWEVVSSSSKSFLTKTFKFLQTKHMMYFINESIRKSDEMDHHPKLIINKDEVVVETYTHDMNDVSSLDKDLASFMDEVFQDIVYISRM
tara:strand:+ start:309 stop:725 length:417 start_codon:yes stop_codon:yes gene_type:complete